MIHNHEVESSSLSLATHNTYHTVGVFFFISPHITFGYIQKNHSIPKDAVISLLAVLYYSAISISNCAVSTRKNITTGYTVA